MKQRPRIYYTEANKSLMWDRWQKRTSERDSYKRRTERCDFDAVCLSLSLYYAGVQKN